MLQAGDLATIRHLLWGRSWPLVLVPPDAVIVATDGELRQLGFIPKFLQNRDLGEIFAFLGWCVGAPEEYVDLSWYSGTRVARRGFIVDDPLPMLGGCIRIGPTILQRIV